MFKATIIGRLAADPELRVIKGNRHMLTFSVVADNGYKDKTTGKYVPQNNTVIITVFGARAEAMARSQYLKKGHLVYVEATCQQSSYVKDGITRYTTNYILDDVKRLAKTLSEMNQSQMQYSDTIPDEHLNNLDTTYSQDTSFSGAPLTDDEPF